MEAGADADAQYADAQYADAEDADAEDADADAGADAGAIPVDESSALRNAAIASFRRRTSKLESLCLTRLSRLPRLFTCIMMRLSSLIPSCAVVERGVT